MILGIDEVGRGSWAGPLVVGAVVLGGVKIDGLTDSKKLTKKQREDLDKVIRKKAKCIGLGWVSANEIDKIGLSKALTKATKKAIDQISVPYDEIIIDGNVNFLKNTNKSKLVQTIKKADLLIPCVSAASIVAKVARDNYMREQNEVHPGYEFDQNVGYGTRRHSRIINKAGLTLLHRKSYWPIKNFAKTGEITTRQIGVGAEDIACKYLCDLGHKVISRNWKNKYCEIDIISEFEESIYFTEVKYRKKTDQGGGLAAITNKKLRQMKFAAEYYCTSNRITDTDLQLAAMSLAGTPATVETFLLVD